jgi:hypothetical protein
MDQEGKPKGHAVREGFMKRLVPSLLVAGAALLVSPPSARAQFTAEEIARRPFYEDFLRTAEIVRSEDIGQGVTKPVRLYLKQGDIEARGVWKNPSGWQYGFWEGWEYEIAAYRLDKLMGLNMVSPAVERVFGGKKGALSYWTEHKYSYLQIMEQAIPIPADVRRAVDDRKYLMRAWDCLIANEDRTQQNILFTADWRTILIDHSRAFRSSKEFRKRLVYGRDGIKTSADGQRWLVKRVPRWFFERLKTLDFAAIKAAVERYLKDDEIRAVLERRELLVREIEDTARAQGESEVIYDR